jgi:acyl carrier protein
MYEQIRNILLACEIEEEKIDSDDYIKEDILDSLTMAEIIIAIEDLYAIEIDAEEIIPENFKNINTIIEVVKKSIASKN